MRSGVFLTGATGFLGAEVLARYLDRGDRPVYALVRARDETAARERLERQLRLTYHRDPGFGHRLIPVPGDIESPHLGLPKATRESLAAEVDEVVHSAATVSFELPLERSRSINVDGTRRVLAFGELCAERGGLRRFAYVSTAYVAGTHRGEFGEDQLDVGQGFRNPYERSKFEAEQVVRERAGRLPLQILRPSIIVGESSTGWTSSFNVLYAPLKAFARGHLPFIPARMRAPVDVVPVDYVADAVFELGREADPGTFHLVASERASNVEELVALAARRLDRRPPLFVWPALYRRLFHPLLLWRSDERRRRALERMETYFPYFSMRVRYRDERARRALAPRGLRVQPIESYFGRLLEFALKADWGRRLLARG